MNHVDGRRQESRGLRRQSVAGEQRIDDQGRQPHTVALQMRDRILDVGGEPASRLVHVAAGDTCRSRNPHRPRSERDLVPQAR